MSALAELRARVDAEVARCMAIATIKYGREFKAPKVTYFGKGRTAGRAWHNKWLVEIHTGLLQQDPEEMVRTTVPHEVAHLIDFEMNPRVRVGGGRCLVGGSVKAHMSSHGPTWQAVMRLFGADPSRTHRMDTSAFTMAKPRPVYACQACKAHGRETTASVGPLKHKRIQAYAQNSNLLGIIYKACKHPVLASDFRRGMEQPRLITALPKPFALPPMDKVHPTLVMPSNGARFVFGVPPQLPPGARPVRVMLDDAHQEKALGREGTVGRTACDALLAGMSDAQVLAAVSRAHHGAKTTQKCVAWYRNKLRKAGLL